MLNVIGRTLAKPVTLVAGWFRGGRDGDEHTAAVAAFLVGAFTLVAGALAVIGLGEGDVDRAVVNEPKKVQAAFALIVAAVCLGSLMSLFKRARPTGFFGVGGLLALGLGLYLLATAAIDGRLAKDRPRVSAHLERTPTGLRVKGSVAAEGLTAKEHVLIRVIGISTRNKLAEAHIGHRRGRERVAQCALADRLDGEDPPHAAPRYTTASRSGRPEARECWRQLAYSSRTGAGADGKASIQLDTPLATGVYERIDVEAQLQENEPPVTDSGAATLDADQAREGIRGLRTARCDKNDGNFACVTLMVPPASRRPELDVRWKLPASTPPVLAITARMGDLSIDDRVQLSIRRVRGGRARGRIYGASWAPSAAGEVNQELEVPIAPKRQKLCVIMRTLRASVLPYPEGPERYGPCGMRSQGMAVQLYGPPRKPPAP